MGDPQDTNTVHRETFPGPGPDASGELEGESGIHPVEQMVDAAIDRLARETALARERTTRPPAAQPLAVRSGPRGPLRWKGFDVSDEFKRYAERIAAGEELPPFRGRVLAQPNPKFPWAPGKRARHARRKGRSAAAIWIGGALFAAGVAGLALAGGGGATDGAATNASAGERTAVRSTRSALTGTPGGSVAEAAETLADRAAVGAHAESVARGESHNLLSATAMTPLEGRSEPGDPAEEPPVTLVPEVRIAPSPKVAAVPSVETEHRARPRSEATPRPPAVATSARDERRRPEIQSPEGRATATVPVAAQVPTRTPSATSSSAAAAPPAESPKTRPEPKPVSRKKPNGEASANGSLLVETPSF